MDGFLKITSRDNSLIKLVSLLQSSSKERKKHSLFVLEGLRICLDAFENGIRFDKFVISEVAAKRLKNEIIMLSKNADGCYILPDSLFKKIADTDSPQGIIALAKIPNKSLEINPTGRYVALENIADPSNLGAISRTAEALGVSGILISKDTCDPYSPKSLRASMGTLLRLPVFVCDDLAEKLKASSLKTYACVVDKDATPISNISFSEGSAIIIGNEANGLTEDIKGIADALVTIPMPGRAESLNAAAAAAIAMWEMVRL